LALSCLRAIEGPNGSHYADMRAFKQSRQAEYLGHWDGNTFYLTLPLDQSVIQAVVRELAGFPMDSAEMRVSLYQLWLTTKHAKMNEDDRDAMLTVYVSKLKGYPKEATSFIIADMTEECPFFPSWSEIRDRLKLYMGWRGDMITALRRLSNQHPNKRKTP